MLWVCDMSRRQSKLILISKVTASNGMTKTDHVAIFQDRFFARVEDIL